MKRRSIIKLVAAMPIAHSQVVRAQDRTNPIRLVVPYAAGGQTDTLARVLAVSMEKTLGQTVVTENRPGAGALLGTRFVIQSPPDGNTLLFHNSGMVSTAVLRKAPPYNPVKDLDPIAMVGVSPNMLMVHESVPARTIPEFLAYARSRPNGIECANSGNNSGGHISALMLQKLANIKIIHIPYKGSAEVTTALLSGEVKMQISVTTESLNPHIKAGKIRVLGVATKERSQLAPELPTIGDYVPGYAMDGWFGILTSAGVDAARKEQLAAAIQKALTEEPIKRKFLELNMGPTWEGPSDFTRRVGDTVGYYEGLIEKLNLVKT
ncbi:MAG: tripartite tricarboxylate transporter substrate binding protein [Burkholderiales bacterium]|nr:tripartite tricarboxylate transporter substrate binding protein [Burkholderiales bacterium]